MNKILVVSDIHIHDHISRCPSDRFRLYQARTVAQNILEAGRNAGCSRIVFAGDIIDKSYIHSYVMAEVRDFLYTVMAGFTEGFIIFGNHDMDVNSQKQTPSDCCLSLLLPPNLYYADQKIANIGNSVCAFSNWKPKFDLSWIPGQVDVLFTHATINYGNNIITSQVLDTTKFGLAICGDIHYPAQSGPFVSIGIPQQNLISDSQVCTGVVYDADAKTFDWIDLNPHDNLLKFRYTQDLSREGYDAQKNTWFVYQPQNITTGAGGVNQISTPVQAEIDEIITAAISGEGLGEVHQTVLEKGGSGCEEVNFDFKLLQHRCHNWRSITDSDISFNPGDRIFVSGSNGSGKSSLLSAIYTAIYGCTNMKDFIRYGEKECWTEIKFEYLGKIHILRRGTKSYGLNVDGIDIPFKGKTEFNNSILERYPFTNPAYQKLFVLNEDNSRFLGSMTDEEFVDLTSKLLKLDKISEYNRIATELFEKIQEEGRTAFEGLANAESRIKEYKDKQALIPEPTESYESLQARLQSLTEIQIKARKYSDYLENTRNQAGKLELYNSEISNLKQKLTSLRQPGTVLVEKEEISRSLEELEGRELAARTRETTIRGLESELARVLEEGRATQGKLDSLSQPICPTCGAKMDQEHYEKHKAELGQHLQELLGVYNDVSQRLEIEKAKTDNSGELRSQMRELQRQLDALKAEETLYLSTSKDLERYQKLFSDLQAFSGNTTEIPEKVDVPEDIVQQIVDIQNRINSGKLWYDYLAEIQKWQEEYDRYVSVTTETRAKLNSIKAYMNLTSPTGKIYETVMSKLSHEFSDNNVKYEVASFVRNKKEHLRLVPYFNHKGNWFAYQTCSSGQKIYMEINLMSKIITGCGLMILDEYLKALDSNNHDFCLDILSKVPVNCMLLSSHNEALAKFNNRQLTVTPGPNGESVITE